MSKQLNLVATLICVVVSLSFCFTNEYTFGHEDVPIRHSQNAVLTEQLRNWSIERGENERPARKPSVSISDCVLGQNRRVFTYDMLTRSKGSNVVAVLQTVDLTSLSLNPEYGGFNYGPFPHLEELTLLQAQALWGIPTTRSVRIDDRAVLIRSFKLISADNSKYVIDCEFTNDYLSRYRVSSPKLTGAWIRLYI